MTPNERRELPIFEDAVQSVAAKYRVDLSDQHERKRIEDQVAAMDVMDWPVGPAGKRFGDCTQQDIKKMA